MVHLPAVPPLDRNGRLVLLGKAFRAFGFGLNSVVLGLYLVELGLDAAAVGAVLSAALVGTTLLTLIIAIFGDRLGRRRVLATGGALMLLSLFVPLVGANPLLLVLLPLSGAVAAARRRFGIHRSRGPVLRLSLLFGLDAFAGGLIVQSFLAIWFSQTFGLAPAAIGALFFAGNLLAAASYPAAALLSARIGLIRTMVFTHIPSSVLLIAMTLVPWAPVAAFFYLGRAAISSMDIPARQSYTMAIVDPDERTATAGVTSPP